MQQSTAKALTDLLLRHAGEQNEILKDVQANEPHEDFVKIRTMIGKTMGSIYADALQPIFEEYPALQPAGITLTRRLEGK